MRGAARCPWLCREWACARAGSWRCGHARRSAPLAVERGSAHALLLSLCTRCQAKQKEDRMTRGRFGRTFWRDGPKHSVRAMCSGAASAKATVFWHARRDLAADPCATRRRFAKARPRGTTWLRRKSSFWGIRDSRGYFCHCITWARRSRLPRRGVLRYKTAVCRCWYPSSTVRTRPDQPRFRAGAAFLAVPPDFA